MIFLRMDWPNTYLLLIVDSLYPQAICLSISNIYSSYVWL
jgi:hypothetical protein